MNGLVENVHGFSHGDVRRPIWRSVRVDIIYRALLGTDIGGKPNFGLPQVGVAGEQNARARGTILYVSRRGKDDNIME